MLERDDNTQQTDRVKKYVIKADWPYRVTLEGGEPIQCKDLEAVQQAIGDDVEAIELVLHGNFEQQGERLGKFIQSLSNKPNLKVLILDMSAFYFEPRNDVLRPIFNNLPPQIAKIRFLNRDLESSDRIDRGIEDLFRLGNRQGEVSAAHENFCAALSLLKSHVKTLDLSRIGWFSPTNKLHVNLYKSRASRLIRLSNAVPEHIKIDLRNNELFNSPEINLIWCREAGAVAGRLNTLHNGTNDFAKTFPILTRPGVLLPIEIQGQILEEIAKQDLNPPKKSKSENALSKDMVSALLSSCETQFNDLVNKVKETLLTKNIRKNIEAHVAVEHLDSALRNAGKSFFHASQGTTDPKNISDFIKECNDAINAAETKLKNHRGYWHQIHPVLKKILGVLAIFTVLPALITLATKQGFKNTFFSLPPTKSQEVLTKCRQDVVELEAAMQEQKITPKHS